MMRDRNGSKPKAQWKPPPDYKSAPAEAHLRTTKPNGQPWDLCKREDRKLARQMVDEQQPEWIVGAPPCKPFSIWNYAMN